MREVGEAPLIVLADGIYDDAIETAGGENAFLSDAVCVSKKQFVGRDLSVPTEELVLPQSRVRQS